MDQVTRIETVARPLLQTVDTTLASHGAPAEHPVWRLLRDVGATPGDAVTFVSLTLATQLREAAERLSEVAEVYREAAGAPAVTWQGRAGEEYAAQVRALGAHLRDDLADAVTDTAGYLADVAQWQEQARLDLARALADVLVSAEAVTLAQARAGGLAEGLPVSRAAVLAAADVAAHVLRAVVGVIEDGEALAGRWAEAAHERPMRAAAPTGAVRTHGWIEVRH